MIDDRLRRHILSFLMMLIIGKKRKLHAPKEFTCFPLAAAFNLMYHT
jgi:hypothetical protein